MTSSACPSCVYGLPACLLVPQAYHGFPEYGVSVNPSKTQLNFDLSLPGLQLPRRVWRAAGGDGSCFIRCGGGGGCRGGVRGRVGWSGGGGPVGGERGCIGPCLPDHPPTRPSPLGLLHTPLGLLRYQVVWLTHQHVQFGGASGLQPLLRLPHQLHADCTSHQPTR